MSCFFSCFRASKNSRRRRRSPPPSPKFSVDRQVDDGNCTGSSSAVALQLPSHPSIPCRDKDEGETTPVTKKNVTFDPNVTIGGDVRSEGVIDDLKQEADEERIKEEGFPVNHRYHNCDDCDDDDDGKLWGDEEDCGLCDVDVEDLEDEEKKEDSCEVSSLETTHRYHNCDDSDHNGGELGGNEEDCGFIGDNANDLEVAEENKGSCGVGSLEVNHRYSNCEDSDEDGGELGGDEEDCELIDDDADDGEVVSGADEDESYHSIVDEKGSLWGVSNPEMKSYPGVDEVNFGTILQKSKSDNQSLYLHSVLNPVENLTRWKEANLQSVTPAKDHLKKQKLDSDTENKVPASSRLMVKGKKLEWSIDSKATPCYSAKQDVSVDASLSTWLVSPDNTTVEGHQESCSRRSNSSFSREERPILGALTVDDIKYVSATSTPRRSPSRSPDETPIIGTVGSYWNSTTQRDYDTGHSWTSSGCDIKGIPNTTSKYREDRKVNWHLTPFEVRLERALNNKGRT